VRCSRELGWTQCAVFCLRKNGHVSPVLSHSRKRGVGGREGHEASVGRSSSQPLRSILWTYVIPERSGAIIERGNRKDDQCEDRCWVDRYGVRRALADPVWPRIIVWQRLGCESRGQRLFGVLVVAARWAAVPGTLVPVLAAHHLDIGNHRTGGFPLIYSNQIRIVDRSAVGRFDFD
jgi:hypothetical protein